MRTRLLRPTVLLTTEGTYPYSRGGVSTWCQQLLEGMPDIRFRVVSLVGNPYLKPLFDPPPNGEILTIPLWGSHGDLRNAFAAQRPVRVASSSLEKPSDSAIELGFLDPFLDMLDASQQEVRKPTSMAYSLLRLYRFFARYDYRSTVTSRLIFDAFGSFLADRYGTGPREATIGDQKLLLSLLARFLMPLSVPIPAAHLTHATVAGWSGLLGVVAKEASGRPLLLTEHGVFLREQLYFLQNQKRMSETAKSFLKRLMRALVLTVYRSADRILPVCGFNARWETALGVDPAKIQIIHNGIPGHFYADPEDLVPPETLDGELISITNINPMKDTETVIRAMGIVTHTHPEARLTVYGPFKHEQYYKYCRDLIRELHLERSVHLAGPTSDVRSKLKPFAISLHISISEALPYAILESMAAGQVIVATGVGGVPEAIGEAGIAVPVRDHEAVARACLELLDDPERRKTLAREANVRAREFALDRMLDSYEGAYHAYFA